MKRDRMAKRVYVRECAGSCSVDRPWKRWNDNVKECLRKRGLDVRQAGEWSRIRVNGGGL